MPMLLFYHLSNLIGIAGVLSRMLAIASQSSSFPYLPPVGCKLFAFNCTKFAGKKNQFDFARNRQGQSSRAGR